jgi:hypothetical protein
MCGAQPVKSDLTKPNQTKPRTSYPVHMHHNVETTYQESDMTTKQTQPQTLSEQLKTLKPHVRTVPKIEVRRVTSRVFGGYNYEVQYVKPTWETLSKTEQAKLFDMFVV